MVESHRRPLEVWSDDSDSDGEKKDFKKLAMKKKTERRDDPNRPIVIPVCKESTLTRVLKSVF